MTHEQKSGEIRQEAAASGEIEGSAALPDDELKNVTGASPLRPSLGQSLQSAIDQLGKGTGAP
jgi:hypothetical protein